MQNEILSFLLAFKFRSFPKQTRVDLLDIAAPATVVLGLNALFLEVTNGWRS